MSITKDFEKCVERWEEGVSPTAYYMPHHVSKLLAYTRALESALMEILPEEPCRYDHNGNCQEHSWFGLNGDKCPIEKTKALIND